MRSRSRERELPVWALPATVVIGVGALGFFGWRTVTGNSDYAGPPKQVHVGQYDLKAEVMKMRAARENKQESR